VDRFLKPVGESCIKFAIGSSTLPGNRQVFMKLVLFQAAWAPGKGVKESQFKDNWDVDLGVTYISWDDLPTDLDRLLEGSILDLESLSESLRSESSLSSLVVL
jgi:hypothetical protein